LLVLDDKLVPFWRHLLPDAELCPLPVPDESYRLNDPPSPRRINLERCLEIARSCTGKFDYVLGECTSAFLWLAIFRLAQDTTPFLLIPRFNHVLGPHTYALLLSSQFALSRDLLLAGSKRSSQAFGRFGFVAEPLYLPGIDLEIWRPPSIKKTDLRPALGLRSDRDLLLYAGRLEDDKNVLELLEVFDLVQRTRPTELVLCFHFKSESYLSKCRERASSIPNVYFVNDPTEKELVRYFQAADLFVSAAVSVFETFGRAPVEAMACGTPPVVAEYDGFRETVLPGTGFLVPTAENGFQKWPDVSRFARVILEALADRPDLEERGRQCVHHARRFGRTEAVRSLSERIGQTRAATSQGSVTVRSMLHLSGYPKEIVELWAPLEGQSLANLLSDFLATGQIPVLPSPDKVESFYRLWFSSY
jgi:glycosyltransferase involved in cell wall biosynthesis